VTLIGIALAPGFGWLIVAAIGFGLWKGMLGVSVNSQAITVQSDSESERQEQLGELLRVQAIPLYFQE
jgi:hypothetical protein